MEERFTTPVQVTGEDSSDSQRPEEPLPMTGQQVSPSRHIPSANVPSSGRDLTSENLQVDAARYNEPAPISRHNARDGGTAADVIEIKDGDRSIVMKNVVAAARPGVTMQIGAVTSMTVYQGSQHRMVVNSARNVHNKHKITDSQTSPSSRHLDMVSDGIAGDWRRLGRCLDMTDAVLDQVNLDYQAQGQREINYQFLRRWTQQGPQTLQTLAQALADIGRGDLADRLSQMS